MLKAVLAVIVGYLAMALLVFSTFSLAYLLMGADGAFRPGTYDVTPLWLVVSFVLSFIAAVVGGWVCATIARNWKAPTGFAAVVFILGLLVAVSVLMASDDARPQVREGNVGNIAAMQNAKQPAWVALMNALIGPAGILLGARLKEGVRTEER
jgi:xanthosine utilization system XapX-like protein